MLTKLNTTKVVGLWSAAGTVLRLAGPPGFFQGLRARVLYQMPSTAISWSVYEFFKHYLNGGSKDKSSYPEDTLADLRLAQSSSRISGEEPEGEKDKERLWDTIVTDLPRQVRGSLRERHTVNSELVHERTFPTYRTEV